MIMDVLSNASRTAALHPAFAAAFEFLHRPDLRALPLERHVIDGDRSWATPSRGPGRKREQAPLESHRRFIDIQFVIAGREEMGWKPTTACLQSSAPYDHAKDVQLYSDEPDTWFTVTPGAFVIFFPEDAHSPLVSTHEIHKVVLKIAL